MNFVCIVSDGPWKTQILIIPFETFGVQIVVVEFQQIEGSFIVS